MVKLQAKDKEYILTACKTLNNKLNVAAATLEEKTNTIINITNREHTVMVWALRRFWDEAEKAEVSEDGK